MSEEVGRALDEHEIDQLLTEQGLGVLGLGNADEAYTIPMAFAYDSTENRCIFRFITTAESRKSTFAAATERASLTVYEWRRPSEWQSVVISGPLRRIESEELAEAATLFSDVGSESALDVFNAPISEYDTEWYELVADEITGRGRFPGETSAD